MFNKMKLIHSSQLKETVCKTLWVFWCILLLLSWNNVTSAQQAPLTPTPPPVREIDILQESLEKTLAAEKESLEQFEERLKQTQHFEKEIEIELNAYKIQISAYNSLLLVSTTPIEELEKVRGNILSELEYIAVRLKELTQERDKIDQVRQKTDQQYTLNQKQLSEIKADPSKKSPGDPETKVLLEKLQALTETLSNKSKMLEKMQTIYAGLITTLEEIQREFTTLSEKLYQQIEDQKKKALFERKANPFSLLGREQIQIEFGQLIQQGGLLISIDFWVNIFQTLLKSEGFLLIRGLSLFGIIQFLLLRLRRFFTNLEKRTVCDEYPWRCLVLRLSRSSLLLLGTTLFIYIYAQVRSLYTTMIPFRVVVYILLIWLFSRWILDFLKLRQQKNGEAAPIQVIRCLRRFVSLIRIFGIIYVMVEWALGASSVILLLGRLIFEISLFIWAIPFWTILRESPQQIFPVKLEARQTVRSFLVSLGYIITTGGLLLELTGYGQLALYWFTYWGRTAVVLLWGSLLILVFREFDQELQKISSAEREKSLEAKHQARWLFIRIGWLLLPALFVISLLLAWGAKQVVIIGALSVLTYPISIGGMEISLLGFVYAFLILVFTHAATHLWRRVLKEKILVNSGMAIGVQVSITTISVYFLWLFGILWALRAIGISTTSLAVAFGALGIGLGFGLQSIFNNFISGLILLFERPIQVGDVIEINGLWGEVEKINVRSTVVRTYDKAALIIPNSDIISRQLTNWTFQDTRIRRTIVVGVAYGTDVKLVEKLLYEIAERHPRVLKDPAPMVLFTDFGDSALMFKLWAWTLLDYALTTDTEIRFEIDRVFREHHITIPFPQRDVHIRPVEKKTEANRLEEEIKEDSLQILSPQGEEDRQNDRIESRRVF